MATPSLFTLLRWLGPWAASGDSPPARRSSIELRAGRDPAGASAYRAYLYEPARRRPAGAYLISPGLHYAGPDDPRFDRFARVLAASGILVLAPFLPDYVDLVLRETAPPDLALAFDWIEAEAGARGIRRPGVFSISFGSWPAAAVAGMASHRDRIGELVLFGGYADFGVAVRFAVTGVAVDGSLPQLDRDTLNTPVVYLNLIRWIDAPGDRGALEAALRSVVRRTWGRDEMRRPEVRAPIVEELAGGLSPEQRSFFREACGLAPGAGERVERALAAAGSALDFADPRPHLGAVRAPVSILHGRDDDVIPWTQAGEIQRALPPGHPHEIYLTGMYGHTGSMLPRVADAAREAITLLGAVRAIQRGARRAG